MKVVLAEKPSVARDLAAFLGARARREGYFEGGGYQVTWAFGHLVGLCEPHEYDPTLRRWSVDTLPILPRPFKLTLTGDSRARAQYKIVASLLRNAQMVICATDAGREGELIFRNIAQYSRCKTKPTQRLWLSSLTTSAIERAFSNLRPAREFEPLAAAARCRSEADWLVGLNATRNYTARHGNAGVLWSVGRVQTPVLALIAARDDQILHFVPEPWFEVRTHYREVLFAQRGDRFKTKAEAEAVVATIKDSELVITAVNTRTERVKPPQLYDLTALQRDMNVRYAMAAAQTLKVVQALYEDKAVTYPRTDSRYLPDSMKSNMGDLLQQLRKTFPSQVAGLDLEQLPLTRRSFDDNKITDHHAIIPTGKVPRMDAGAKRVYDAIALRTIASFYPDCVKELTTVDALAVETPFRAKGTTIVKAGFTEVLQLPSKPGKPGPKGAPAARDEQVLPAFTRGERGPHQPEVKAGETKPPRHYTENSLLGAMETAGRLVDDELLKEALKARGLGTPATRAAIIETLLRRSYIERDAKALHATDLGRYLIALIRDPILKSAELTGEWEAKLGHIAQGKLDPAEFMHEVERFTRALVTAPSDRRDSANSGAFGPCPRCGAPVIEGARAYGCSKWKTGCSYVLSKEFEGLAITHKLARDLLLHRLAHKVEWVANGTEQTKALCLTDAGQIRALSVPTSTRQRASTKGSPGSQRNGDRSSPSQAASLGACPNCGQPVVDRAKSYCCSAWQSGCAFAIWKKIAGKTISTAMASKLLQAGRTQQLKGFVSKANKKFDARLRLDDGKVRFDFD